MNSTAIKKKLEALKANSEKMTNESKEHYAEAEAKEAKAKQAMNAAAMYGNIEEYRRRSSEAEEAAKEKEFYAAVIEQNKGKACITIAEENALLTDLKHEQQEQDLRTIKRLKPLFNTIESLLKEWADDTSARQDISRTINEMKAQQGIPADMFAFSSFNPVYWYLKNKSYPNSEKYFLAVQELIAEAEAKGK